MKKSILKVALFAAIVAAAGWNISQNESKVKLSDFALENVEALANGEGGGLPQCHYEVTMKWIGDFGEVFLQKVCIANRGRSCC